MCIFAVTDRPCSRSATHTRLAVISQSRFSSEAALAHYSTTASFSCVDSRGFQSFALLAIILEPLRVVAILRSCSATSIRAGPELPTQNGLSDTHPSTGFPSCRSSAPQLVLRLVLQPSPHLVIPPTLPLVALHITLLSFSDLFRRVCVSSNIILLGYISAALEPVSLCLHDNCASHWFSNIFHQLEMKLIQTVISVLPQPFLSFSHLDFPFLTFTTFSVTATRSIPSTAQKSRNRYTSFLSRTERVSNTPATDVQLLAPPSTSYLCHLLPVRSTIFSSQDKNTLLFLTAHSKLLADAKPSSLAQLSSVPTKPSEPFNLQTTSHFLRLTSFSASLHTCLFTTSSPTSPFTTFISASSSSSSS